jgi:hypothetical protein
MPSSPKRPSTSILGTLLIVLIAGLLACVPATAAAATAFSEPEDYPTVARFDVVAEDLDHDGDDDLVSAGNGEVAVRLSDGEGGFGDGTSFPILPSDDVWLEVGDLNGDGHADAIASPRVRRKVVVLYGDGNGGFGPAVEVASTTGWGNVAIGDFGGDAAADIVALNHSAGSFETFVQESDGTFTPAATVEVGGGFRHALAVADLNSDGRTDVVTANGETDDVSIVLQADGGFAAPVRHDVGDYPRDVELADIDGEAGLDIVTADWLSGSVSVLSSTGAGQFAESVSHGIGAEFGPTGIAVEDLDHDGDQDLVTALSSHLEVVVLIAEADGSFSPFPAGRVYRLHQNGRVATGHFDQDGEVDLALPTVPIDENEEQDPSPPVGAVSVMFGDLLHLDTHWLDWGNRMAGDSISWNIRVRNASVQPVGLGAIGFVGSAGPFWADAGGCGATLAVNQSCQLAVGFNPVSVAEATDHEALLEVPGDGSTGPRYVFLAGTSWPASAVFPPLIGGNEQVGRSTSRLSFSTLPGTPSAPQSVIFTNRTDRPLNVRSTSVTGAFVVQADTCANTLLQPEASCTVTLFFRPSAMGRTSRGLLRIGVAQAPSVSLFGIAEIPRPPISYDRVPGDLKRLARSVRRLVRGGPSRVLRMPVFTAPAHGTLSFRLYTRRSGERIPFARASRRAFQARQYRLPFRLSKRARKFLRRASPTRATAVVTFDPAGAQAPFVSTQRLLVPAPRAAKPR